MVLSAYGKRRKEEMEKLEGRTIQQEGEGDLEWIQRMCAINAQRCRDDPRHHQMADEWERQRALRNAKNEEREALRAAQNEAHEKQLERERIRQRRSKALKEGKLEYYKACGPAYSLDWLRAEIVPHLPDYRTGSFLAGTGTTALREGVERMRRMVKNGRPVRDKTAFVAKYARMMHEGRFTEFLDPAVDHCKEDLLVLEGDSPFDKKMVLDDAGAWVVPKGMADVEWKLKIPNDEGWLPGAKAAPLEKDRLSDIGKYNSNAKPKRFAPLGEQLPDRDPSPPVRTIVQPPLRHSAPAKVVDPVPTRSPAPARPPAPAPAPAAKDKRAFVGPPPSRKWCERYLWRFLPEQRTKAIKPYMSQKAYGKALIDTLAFDRPEWSPEYRAQCFDYCLQKYHGMTEADVAREAEIFEERKRQYQASLRAAHEVARDEGAVVCGEANEADEAPTQYLDEHGQPRMRQPGED